ncbi:MAG: hypothetical protein ACPG32_00540 [Akkermansiaceae bacterium]
MKEFHRVKKDSRLVGFIGLGVVLFLSMFFMLIGFVGVDERGWNALSYIFGIPGVLLFGIFIRGAWMATKGAVVHVFSMDNDEIQWGFLGKEKSIPVRSVSSIHWSEVEGFGLLLNTSEGRIRLPYIENALSVSGRAELLAYLRTNHRSIEIDGYIDPKTEKASGEYSQ